MDLHSTKERLRSLMSAPLRRQQPVFSIYPKVPLEVVLAIFKTLSTLDQICLSLCCKYTYEAFIFFLDTRRIKICQIVPPYERPLLCRKVDIDQRRRVRLLRRLEDHRWAFCNECWYLYPRTEGTLNLSDSLSLGYFELCKRVLHHVAIHRKGESLPRPHGIRPCVGEVEICPCLTITIRDKLHLIEAIRCAREMLFDEDDRFKQLRFPSSRSHGSALPSSFTASGGLDHECTFTDHPFASVRIKTLFWVQDDINNLFTRSRYEFTMLPCTSSTSIPSGLETPFIFPEENIRGWLRRFFDEAGTEFSGWDKRSSIASLRHGWPTRFAVQIVRNLGDQSWPNEDWSQRCRK